MKKIYTPEEMREEAIAYEEDGEYDHSEIAAIVRQGANAVELLNKIRERVMKTNNDFDIAYYMEMMTEEDSVDIEGLYDCVGEVKKMFFEADEKSKKEDEVVKIEMPTKALLKAHELLVDEAKAMANAVQGLPCVKGQWLPVRGCMDDKGDDWVVLRAGHGISLDKEDEERMMFVVKAPYVSEVQFVKDVNKLNKADGFPLIGKTFRYSEVKEYLGVNEKGEE